MKDYPKYSKLGCLAECYKNEVDVICECDSTGRNGKTQAHYNLQVTVPVWCLVYTVLFINELVYWGNKKLNFASKP